MLTPLKRNLYLELITPTPLVPVTLPDSERTIWCKLEFLHPSGSTKDRVAAFILGKAWRSGQIGPDSVVVEASSGSTSIAMAMVCAQLGIKFIAVMPEGVSNERSAIIRGYGGEAHFSPREEGIRGALNMVEDLANEPGVFLPRQFANPDNAAAHRLHTAREIIAQIPGGRVDAMVSGVGTGGTLVGLYHGLRDYGCHVRPFAAKPVTRGASANPLCFAEAECCSFSHRIPGVVEKISQIYRPDELEELVEIEVHDEVALETTRQLIRCGFPVGPSSGLNFAAALLAAERLGENAAIVTVFPDRMERYFSTELFPR